MRSTKDYDKMIQPTYFTAIYAVSENGVMGADGDLPWRSSADLRWFKSMTKKHVIIMGRKTFESLPGGALNDRLNIVLTRNKRFRAPGAIVVSTLRQAAHEARALRPGAQMFVIGGGALLQEAFAYCSDACVSTIHTLVEMDKSKEIVYAPMLPATARLVKTVDLHPSDKACAVNDCAASANIYQMYSPKCIFNSEPKKIMFVSPTQYNGA